MDLDLYELVKYLCEQYGVTYEEEPSDSELEDDFYNAYEIHLGFAEELIRHLLPLCAVAKSELTDKVYQGFGIGNLWLMKKEVK